MIRSFKGLGCKVTAGVASVILASGVFSGFYQAGSVANAEETAENNAVVVSKVDQAYDTYACIYFDGLTGQRNGNGVNVHQDAEKVGNYIYFNDVVSTSAGRDVHMRSNMFWVYGGEAPVVGDTITFKNGMAFPIVTKDGEPVSGYRDSLGGNFTYEFTSTGWVVVSDAPNVLENITPVKLNEAGETTPESYSFSLNFKGTVDEERTELENDANYANNIYLNGKSVTEINKVKTTDNYGVEINPVTISSMGTTITINVIKKAEVVDLDNFNVKISKEFKSSNGINISDDFVRYYVNGLDYWSTLQSYEIEKTAPITIESVKFSVIDNGVNGCIDIVFNDNIVENPMLFYNCHPTYLKTLPAVYPIDKADELASSGATLNFINNIKVNGKTIAEFWAEQPSVQAKSEYFQCHITPDAKTLSIRTKVDNGFDGNNDITLVLNKGLTFLGGKYIEKDTVIKYNAAKKEVSSFVSSLNITVNDKNVAVELKENGTATINFVATENLDSSLIKFVSSAVEIVKIDKDGKITAVKAGTATIYAEIGDEKSNEITITVKAEEKPVDPKPEAPDSESTSEEKKSGCGSIIAINGILMSTVLIGGAIVALKKKDRK